MLKAAQLLGVGRPTLYRWARRNAIDLKELWFTPLDQLPSRTEANKARRPGWEKMVFRRRTDEEMASEIQAAANDLLASGVPATQLHRRAKRSEARMLRAYKDQGQRRSSPWPDLWGLALRAYREALYNHPDGKHQTIESAAALTSAQGTTT